MNILLRLFLFFPFFPLFFISPAMGAADASSLPSNLHALGATDSIRAIDVQAVYYIYSDATPLADWRERIEYHLRRAQKFHQREFGGLSAMNYSIHPQPYIASASREAFPKDDPNNFFWHIVNDVLQSGAIHFQSSSFPILLVFSDMNFSPGYSDWTRECSGEGCPFPPPHSDCKGWVTAEGEDRPGSRCGGARAVFWPEKHMGLGLVTADGWRVPIKGSDCVVYHEGIGHSIGLPHPEPLNNSVMGLAQYVDGIQKTWIDDDQKMQLGWPKMEINRADFFSSFEANHIHSKPKPGVPVSLAAKFPEGFTMKSCLAVYQTAVNEAFTPLPKPTITKKDGFVYLNWFMPPRKLGESAAYRVRVETISGETEEFWDYYKIRE
ncbi:MAG: hypothetical protein AB1656_20985 [Candidatus Omnitrophota bacterium]